MQGKGNSNDAGSNPGDLIVKVSVKEDPYFKRDAFDIITDGNITISQAVLGDDINVRTLVGQKNIHVAGGTQDGDKVILHGLGVSKLPPNQGQKGDHIVNLRIMIPTKLTDK